MSNAPRIYVRGSYIDIHDNENVYLTVDKDGEVKTHIDEKQIQKTNGALLMWIYTIEEFYKFTLLLFWKWL